MSISKRGYRMIRIMVLAFTAAVLTSLVPLNAVEGRQRMAIDQPPDNIFTRSAALYIQRGESARERRPNDAQGFFRDAMESSENSIKNDPANGRGWYQNGYAAVELAVSLLRNNPDESVLDLLVRADTMLARAVELFPAYRQYATNQRNKAWGQAFNSGTEAVRTGNFAVAVDRMKSAAAIDPTRPTPHLSLANIYTQQGDWDNAKLAYEKTLELLGTSYRAQPGAPRTPARGGVTPQQEWERDRKLALFNLAQLYGNSQEFEKAEELYKQYLAMEPDNLGAKQNLAIVYLRQEKLEEAADIYAELIKNPELAPIQYYTAGIGLYRVRRLPEATDAFEMAVKANPVFRDAMFNLAQSIFARTVEIEQARADLAGEDSVKAVAELTELYDKLIDTTKLLGELDPLNRSVKVLEGRAYRFMTDLTEGEEQEAWYEKFLQLIREIEAMPIDVPDARLVYHAEHVQVTGTVENLTLEPGSQIRLRFSLLDAEGEVLHTHEVGLTAPAKEERVPFEFQAENKGYLGWKYELIS